MSEDQVLANQKTSIEKQKTIGANEKKRVSNQSEIKRKQDKRDKILKKQEEILANKRKNLGEGDVEEGGVISRGREEREGEGKENL